MYISNNRNSKFVMYYTYYNVISFHEADRCLQSYGKHNNIVVDGINHIKY